MAMSKTHWKAPITADRLRELLDYNPETGAFVWKKSRRCIKAGSSAGTLNSLGYIAIKVDGRLYRAHRLAWLWMTGTVSPKEIDHANRVRSDNRFCNLREATSAQNKHNASLRSNNTSGMKGVSYCKDRGKYVAQICVDGMHKNLGRFPTPEEAAAKYRAAADRLHGEFAHTGECK
jgi:hypothetical protein